MIAKIWFYYEPNQNNSRFITEVVKSTCVVLDSFTLKIKQIYREQAAGLLEIIRICFICRHVVKTKAVVVLLHTKKQPRTS